MTGMMTGLVGYMIHQELEGGSVEETAVVTHAPDTEDYYGWRHWMGGGAIASAASATLSHCRGPTEALIAWVPTFI